MTNYSPMSKEFQDECKKLGLTGRQLTAKYQKEGKFVKKDEEYKDKRYGQKYTKKEALDGLKRYCEKNGRPPVALDLLHNSEYPSIKTYQNLFGTLSNALKLVDLDIDTMIKNGSIDTTSRKGRLGEMIVRDHFKGHHVDLAGENCLSPCDGICPNGLVYDVKSSKLYELCNGEYNYNFGIYNSDKEKIKIIYLLGFNKDYTKLMYAWRVPFDIISHRNSLYVGLGLGSSAEFNIENMKQYDITEKLRDILIKYGLLCH